jgi:hypothetical protein
VRRRELAANGPTVAAWVAGPSGSGSTHGNRHIDLFCHLIPGQALVTQLHDLLCGDGMWRRTAATHADANALELLGDCAPVNVQLGTDLAQAPALGVQVGCTLNVHGATVASKSWRAPTTRELRPTSAASPPGCWPTVGFGVVLAQDPSGPGCPYRGFGPAESRPMPTGRGRGCWQRSGGDADSFGEDVIGPSRSREWTAVLCRHLSLYRRGWEADVAHGGPGDVGHPVHRLYR